MTKKSRKGKQRRQQVSRSRKGQVSKKRPKADDIESLDDLKELLGEIMDEDESIVLPASLMNILGGGEPPLAEDGFRIVGPAQAMVDYARPLMENAESEKDLNKAFTIAQTIWNLTLLKDKNPEEFSKKKKEMIDELGTPESEDMVNMMIDRFEKMFPFVGKEMSFYMKERVIDKEEYEVFDESTINISPEKIPPAEMELGFAGRLKKIDPLEDEEELTEWKYNILDSHLEWYIAKGIQEKAEKLVYIVGLYLDFLRDQIGKNFSTDTPARVLQQFMHSYFIRKTDLPAWQKSMMPAALKLFMRYLDEKGIFSGTERIIKIIESEQDTFQKNLRSFIEPSKKR